VSAEGNKVSSHELHLDSTEIEQYMADNPAFVLDIKSHSYDLGKAKGIIPQDAGVS